LIVNNNYYRNLRGFEKPLRFSFFYHTAVMFYKKLKKSLDMKSKNYFINKQRG